MILGSKYNLQSLFYGEENETQQAHVSCRDNHSVTELKALFIRPIIHRTTLGKVLDFYRMEMKEEMKAYITVYVIVVTTL